MAWDPFSLPKDHCVSLQLANALENSTRQRERWLWDGKLDLLSITRPLHSVVASHGVHVPPRVNAQLAHVVLTHLANSQNSEFV